MQYNMLGEQISSLPHKYADFVNKANTVAWRNHYWHAIFCHTRIYTQKNKRRREWRPIYILYRDLNYREALHNE